MPRIRWRDFTRGLWVAGGRDNVPDGALRRASGISQINESAIRSARGQRLINSFPANQYIRFNDALFQAEGLAGTDILRDGVAIGSFPQTLVAPARISFLRMPPQAELVDWLFVAGGGNPFKVKADGTDASAWGIETPADGMVGSSPAPTGDLKTISAMDTAADWVRVQSAGAVPADEATITVSAASVKWSFTDAGTNSYANTQAALTLNLTKMGTGSAGRPSADQDYIDFYIRLSGDTAIGPAAENFDWLEVAFALGTTDFDDNVKTRRIDGVDGTISQAGLGTQQVGSGTYALDQNLSETLIVGGQNVFNPNADSRGVLNAIAQTTVMRQNDVWQRIRIPKITFDQVGSNLSLTWADVKAARLTFKRSGQLTIFVDTLALTGGYGLQGGLKYLQVFKNSATGSRSNPNPTFVQVDGVNRGYVQLGNIQQPTDPQVDKIEIYRTVGNGEAFFFAFELDVGTITTFDTVVDFRGMFSAPYIADVDLPAVLSSTEVRLDNAPVPTTIREVLSHPHLGRAWWLDSAEANRGNLYFSPAGRPESTGGGEDGGFLSITTQTDNVLQTIARWNDALYVFSNQGLYRVVGDDEPFASQEVFGVPGTVQPDTVVETPFGLVWMATDGVRLFDGTQSQMLGNDALGPLFRGYDAENLVAFEGVTAAYFKEDYFVGDGDNELLVLHLPTQTWRQLALRDAYTLYGADDDVELIAGFARDDTALGSTQLVEDEAADLTIAYQVQTGSKLTAVDTKGIIQRVFIDIDSAGLQVTPTLVLDDSEIELAPLTTAARETVEYARLDLSNLIAIRLQAIVTNAPIILYGIELDVYVPEGTGSQS